MSEIALIFVDCEAPLGAQSPATANMTEFGAVAYPSMLTFHGIGQGQETMTEFRDWLNSVCGDAHPVFVSDNPAYDFQWINCAFDSWGMKNPFGHSARRIGDYYAGLIGNWRNSSGWKRLRVTRHDHNPVHDAMGNAEAFDRLQGGER